MNQFDQVLAELRHANRLIESGVVAQNSLVFVSAKKGRQYDLGTTTVKVDPVHEADALYLGTDGLIHLHEVKNTATALRNKFKKNFKQLKRMQKWQREEPHKREIRIVIGTEAGWTELFSQVKHENKAVLRILINANIPLTISDQDFTDSNGFCGWGHAIILMASAKVKSPSGERHILSGGRKGEKPFGRAPYTFRRAQR